MTPQHPQLAELLAQYQAANRERVDLLARRRQMIETFHRTGKKDDAFNEVLDCLRINEDLMTVLRNAVTALSSSRSAQ